MSEALVFCQQVNDNGSKCFCRRYTPNGPIDAGIYPLCRSCNHQEGAHNDSWRDPIGNTAKGPEGSLGATQTPQVRTGGGVIAVNAERLQRIADERKITLKASPTSARSDVLQQYRPKSHTNKDKSAPTRKQVASTSSERKV